MKQCILAEIYGGRTQINDISGLVKAMKEEDHLTKEVLQLFQNDKVTVLLKDKEKLNKMVDFYNRLEPGFRNKIPSYVETLNRIGYLG